MRLGVAPHRLWPAHEDELDGVLQTARTAEELGFDHLIASSHLLAGAVGVTPDPLVLLSAVAGATARIRLVTSVLVLPLYQPVVVAHQTATLDRLSGGRFTLGVGIGWSREEFDALGIPFERRAQRTEEYVAAMRTLWRDDVASFNGQFVNFDSVRVNPKPHQRRSVPVVLGGNSDAALRRVAGWGDGWYGFNLDDVRFAAERVEFLRARCTDRGRDPGELRLALALRDLHIRDVGALSDLGVDELVIVDAPPEDARVAAEWVSALADHWMPALR
jgi:probable F420-dependent oxidoreductase